MFRFSRLFLSCNNLEGINIFFKKCLTCALDVLYKLTMGTIRTFSYVKDLRKRLGLTQMQFADLLGIKRYNLAKYETSTIVPGDVLLRMQVAANEICVCEIKAQQSHESQ